MANDFNMEKFIAAVRSRPPLWDQHDPNYRRLELTLGLWKSITEEMGGNITVNELKQKWYSLRDCFRRELRLARAGRKKKKWIYYNQMTFLSSAKILSKNPWKNKGSPHVKNEEIDPDLNNTTSDHSDLNESINYESVMQDVLEQGHGQIETVDSLTVTPDVNPEEGELARYCKTGSENEGNKTQGGEFSGDGRYSGDDDYHFAMSLIPHMRQVPMQKKLRMRIKIFKIIAEESGFDDSTS